MRHRAPKRQHSRGRVPDSPSQVQSLSQPHRSDSSARRYESRRATRRKHSGKRRSPLWSTVRETFLVILVAVVISALIKAFLLQAFQIPSSSMENTLEVNDRILVTKLTPSLRKLNRGDIVVFSDSQNWLDQKQQKPAHSAFTSGLILLGLRPDDSNNHLVKRIIGLPGDHVQCCDVNKNLKVNGVSIVETPYLKPGVAPSEVPFDVTVPPGKLWVMGDNRANSEDSRFHMQEPGQGFVPISDVTGRAFVTMWPLSRIHTLKNTEVFAAVPPAQ